MPKWRIRDLKDFPPEWARGMLAGEGEKQLQTFYTEKAARGAQKAFQLFRYSIRQGSPSHPLARAESGFLHRLQVRRNAETGMWELWLTTRKFSADVMEVVEKTVDS